MFESKFLPINFGTIFRLALDYITYAILSAFFNALSVLETLSKK